MASLEVGVREGSSPRGVVQRSGKDGVGHVRPSSPNLLLLLHSSDPGVNEILQFIFQARGIIRAVLQRELNAITQCFVCDRLRVRESVRDRHAIDSDRPESWRNRL